MIDAVRAALLNACGVLQNDRRVLRRRGDGEVIADLLPDRIEGLVICADRVFRLIPVAGARSAAPCGPADKAVALAGERILAELLRNAVCKRLRIHRSFAAVGLEADGVGLRRPTRGVGRIRIDHGVGLELVLAVEPAVKVIAGAARRGNGGAERAALAHQNGLGRYAAAVRVERDRPAVRPVCKEGEAAVLRLGDGGIRVDGRAALGGREPAVKDLAAVRRDGQVAVGEGGGIRVPLVFAEGLTVDCAAGRAIACPFQRFDQLDAAPAVVLLELAAVGVPCDVVDRRAIAGRDDGVRCGHGCKRLVPFHAHAVGGDVRIDDRRAEPDAAVRIGVVGIGDGIVAGLPGQGVAVAGVIELEHQLSRSLAAHNVPLVIGVKGEALKLLRRSRNGRARLGLDLHRRRACIAVAGEVFQIGLDLIFDRGRGIFPRLPAQNREAVRAVLPVRAKRLGQAREFLGGLLRTVAGVDVTRKGGVQIIAVGRRGVCDRAFRACLRDQRAAEIAVADRAAGVAADAADLIALVAALVERAAEIAVRDRAAIDVLADDAADIVIVGAGVAVVHGRSRGAEAHRAGVLSDQTAERRVGGRALFHRARVHAAARERRAGVLHADQAAGLFTAADGKLLHADVRDRALRRARDRAGVGAAGIDDLRRIDNEVFHDGIRVEVGKHADVAARLRDVDGHGVTVAVKRAVEAFGAAAERLGHGDVIGQPVAAGQICDLAEAGNGNGFRFRRCHHRKQAQTQRQNQQHCGKPFSDCCHVSSLLF